MSLFLFSPAWSCNKHFLANGFQNLPEIHVSRVPSRARYLKLQELAFRVTQFKCCALHAEGESKPDYSKLQSNLLRVRLPYIRMKGIWHATRLLHRMRMALLSSEMMAESTASVIRFLEKKHAVGHSLSLATLMDSTMLRVHGIRGCMEELPFIRACLHEHFGDEIPHFFVQPGHRKSRERLLGPSQTLQRLRAA